MELAAVGEDLKKLREIAKIHIEKAAGGDMQAIKELADRLDGKPSQVLEHEVPENGGITKIVREFVHVTETREQIESESNDGLVIEHNEAINGNGHDGGHS